MKVKLKDLSAIRRLLEINFPLVFIDVPVELADICVVSTDNQRATAGLAERCFSEELSDAPARCGLSGV